MIRAKRFRFGEGLVLSWLLLRRVVRVGHWFDGTQKSREGILDCAVVLLAMQSLCRGTWALGIAV